MTDSTGSLARRLAHHAANVLPRHRAAWGEAIRNEVEFIESDTAALRWAAGCVIASYAERINPMSNAAISPVFGVTAVMVFVFGGYWLIGGHTNVIVEALPYNLTIIVLGAAAAVSIGTTIGGPGIFKSIGLSLRGRGFRKADYRDLAATLFQTLSAAGKTASLPADEAAARMIADAKALLERDQVSADQLGAVLKSRIDAITDAQRRAVRVLRTLGRALLWFGGLSVLLGLTHVSLELTRAPEVVGGMFGSAMTGLIFGVAAAVGVIYPLANRLDAAIADDANFYGVIRTAFFCRKAGSDAATAVQIASGAVPTELGLSSDDMTELARA